MQNRCIKSRKGAFTLVELLVVIGIIALLVSILLPTLSGARKQAQQVKCQNNMRQLMLAVVMYTNENRLFLPFANWGGPSTNISPTNGTYDYGWLYRTSTCSSPAKPTDVQDGVLYKYVKNADVFKCPLWDLATVEPGSVTNSITSFTMNGAACGFDVGNSPIDRWRKTKGAAMPSYKITTILRGAEKVLFWEGDELPGNGGAVFNDGASYPWEESLSIRHGAGAALKKIPGNQTTNPYQGSGLGANVAYLDSHVELMTASQFYNDSQKGGTTPNELYWNPETATGH